MRVSFDPDDRAYVDPRSMGGDLLWGTTVYLDGVEQRDVYTADDEAGEVVRFARDAAGECFLADADRIATEKLTGSVRIVLPDGVTYDMLHRIAPDRFP